MKCFHRSAVYILALLCGGLASFLTASRGEAQQTIFSPGGIFTPGAISGVEGNLPLHYLFPEKLRQACLLLEHGDSAAAAALFAHELQEDPDDRYAFIGLAQSEPTRWPAEIRDLRAKLARNPFDLNAEFDLAVLLNYDQLTHLIPGWNIFPQSVKYTQEFMEPLHLIQAVWAKQKTAEVGAMYAGIMFRRVSDSGLRKLLGSMIQILTLPPAYQMFLNAKNGGWRDAPPPARLVPVANRRAMFWMLLYLHSDHGIQFTSPIFKNGKQVGQYTTPIKPQDKRAMAYISRWIKELHVKE